MKFLVAAKYELNIADDLIGNYKRINGSVEAIPYSNELMRGYDVAYENWCYEYLMHFLPTNSKVIEFMGGVGCTALIIQDRLKPHRHVIYELDAGLSRHLAKLLPECYIRNGNSYKWVEQPEHIDVAFVDNNTWTALRLERDAEYMRFMDCVFKHSDYVLFTDTAISKIHLNKGHYSKVFDVDVCDMNDYLDALSWWTESHYDHRVVAVATHSRASYILFAKQGQLFQAIVKVPPNAKDYLRRID